MNEENRQRRQFESSDECDVPTFGHPVGNDGWIRCKSKTFPDKYYYFNVDSRSRTWGRPLASCVPMPIVNPVNLQRDEDFWDEAPIEVSDIENDDEEDFDKENIDAKPPIIGVKEAKRRKIFADVLFKLYHCYGDDYSNSGDIFDFTTSNEAPLICKSEIVDDIGANDENSSSILPEICYSSSSDSESSEVRPKKNRQRSPRLARTTLAKQRANNRNDVAVWTEVPNADYLRFGKFNVSSSVIPIERRLVNFWAGRSVPFSIQDSGRTFTRIGLDSDDADEENEDAESEDEETKEKVKMEAEEISVNSSVDQSRSFLPRLKAIEFTDLITDPLILKTPKPKDPPKRRATKLVTIDGKSGGDPSPKKVTKTIYEMNGIKTINYDFLDPELPPGVRASNLSDSGSSNTEIAYNDWAGDRDAKSGLIETKDQKDLVLKDEFMDMDEPRLSDSETSGSSSGSDGNAITKRSNAPISESDSSESSSSSSSSSGSSSTSRTTRTLAPSMSEKVKKEEPDSRDISTPEMGSISEFLIFPNLKYKQRVKSESSRSSRSSCSGDRTWRMSDSQTDDDE